MNHLHPFTKKGCLLSIAARLVLVLALLVTGLGVSPAPVTDADITYAPRGSVTRTDRTPEHRSGLSVGQDNAGSGPGPPAGLSAGDWATIQERIRRAEYHLTWHEPSAAYRAPNRAHGWQIAFTASGVRVTPAQGGDWEWGLTPVRYGYRGQLQAVASTPTTQTVNANRIDLLGNQVFGKNLVSIGVPGMSCI